MKSQPLAITRLVIFRAITRHANFSSLLRDSASPREILNAPFRLNEERTPARHP